MGIHDFSTITTSRLPMDLLTTIQTSRLATKSTTSLLIGFTLLFFTLASFWRHPTALSQISSNDNPSSSTISHLIGSNDDGTTTTIPTNPQLDFSKAAVIIETRVQPKLIPLLIHYIGVLGPTWPIIMYTHNETIPLLFPNSSTTPSNTNTNTSPLHSHLLSGQLTLRPIPTSTTFPTGEHYSHFLTRLSFWASLAPAEHILIFQSDAMLCAAAPLRVDDFFAWDLVGAPVAPPWGVGYNGGLSLRRRSSTMRVLRRYAWEKYPRPAYEDQWFYKRLLELQAEDQLSGGNSSIRLPDPDVAKTFAVETIDYARPVGVHQARRYRKKEELDLDVYCPEYKLCSQFTEGGPG